MSSKVLISIGYGKCVLPTSSITMSAMSVSEGFKRELASNAHERTGRVVVTPVGEHESNGTLYSDTIYVEEGAILLAMYRETYLGRPARDGAVFMRVRNTGPLLRISACLPAHRQRISSEPLFPVLLGRGDLLSAEDLQALPPGRPDKRFIQAYMDPEEVEECFDISILSPETAPAPAFEVHEASDGTKVVLSVGVEKRRMRIRRPT